MLSTKEGANVLDTCLDDPILQKSNKSTTPHTKDSTLNITQDHSNSSQNGSDKSSANASKSISNDAAGSLA